jgi:hypothetical protein
MEAVRNWANLSMRNVNFAICLIYLWIRIITGANTDITMELKQH